MARCDLDTVCVHEWGKHGSGDGQFNRPEGLALGSNDVIYVCDSGNNRIQAFQLDGAFIGTWGRKGDADGDFCRPSGIVIEASGRINESILVAMRSVSQLAAFPPGVLPICASYVGNERIYVCDSGNHRIQVFDVNGKFTRKWGKCGNDDGQFFSPSRCAVGVDEIYVADSWNHRIQVFDLNGRFLRKWGELGQDLGQFDRPVGLAISDIDGLLYVADCDNNRLQCFKSDGTFVQTCGNDDQVLLTNPLNLILHKGTVYVTNSQMRIFLIRIDGTFIGQLSPDFVRMPTGMAMGIDGVLYVADTVDHRIVAIGGRHR